MKLKVFKRYLEATCSRSIAPKTLPGAWGATYQRCLGSFVALKRQALKDSIHNKRLDIQPGAFYTTTLKQQ